MQERTIIDGRQRLTTLQLLLDALHAELLAVDAEQPAMRVETLVMNAPPFWERPEDRFKVWPTNRDRQVRTPQMVFMKPQRLIVPLFQRPYAENPPHPVKVTRVSRVHALADVRCHEI